MNDDPYESPQTATANDIKDDTTRENLRKVASAQRGVNFCVLAYLIMAVAQFVVPVEMRLIFTLLFVVVVITGAVFGFILSARTYGLVGGIILGILILVPILGLLILVGVNGKATKMLKEHGVKVGILGANPSTIK